MRDTDPRRGARLALILLSGAFSPVLSATPAAASQENTMSHTPAVGESKPNHLAGQTSPYLLQHLYNPVDWHAWGAEALAKARKEDKPIFLSIGYAACHWCHVMEHESFENQEVAVFLNAHFVPIKVDREERPDLDDIYMNAVQLMTGSGGWPLSVFLTPDLKPFFGGTYYPPDDRGGRPGFLSLLKRIQLAWAKQREEIERSAGGMTERLRSIAESDMGPAEDESAGRKEIARAAAELAARFDDRWGGFGGAPKFPPHGALQLLLREHARSGEKVPLAMVEKTLDGMASGGMYDQIGGGFARYSVDERWLVPHFEKMLYDNALLVPVYVDAWLVLRKPLYRRIAEDSLDFVRREMTDGGGGFYSSLDADSEGHEGKFYVWTPEEVRAVLGEADGKLFCKVFGITPEGNFEGKSIPNLLGGALFDQAKSLGLAEQQLVPKLAAMRQRLLAARGKRVRPATDDKILTAWNGLMITAFSRAYQAFGRPEDLRSAKRAADFILGSLYRDNRLLVSYRAGKARLNAYLDDHAFLARGLLDLYETSFDRKYLDASASIARTLVARFGDKAQGGFFFTSDDHESLLTRNRSVHDGALPAGSGVAAEALLRLALHLNDDGLRGAAERALKANHRILHSSPSAFAALLTAADFSAGAPPEIAIVGSPDDPATHALLDAVRRRYIPNRVVALGVPGASTEGLPLLTGKTAMNGKATAYFCRNYVCQAPTHDPAILAKSLGG